MARRYTFILPSGRRVGARAYVSAWRTLAATETPDALVTGWDHFPTPAREILAAMRRGLHHRINQRGGIETPEGRAHPCAYSKARTPRVILEPCDVRPMPPAARRALASRIREE